MAKIPTKPKTIRKLVTLPPELAERVEKYRVDSGAASESDALKALIEDGRKRKDTPRDLIKRFQSATTNGLSVGEVVSDLAADHPLVRSSFLDGDALVIYLKTPSDVPAVRFHYSRSLRTWQWQLDRYGNGNEDGWETIPIDPPAPSPSQTTAGGYGGGYPGASKSGGQDLDDDIPF